MRKFLANLLIRLTIRINEKDNKIFCTSFKPPYRACIPVKIKGKWWTLAYTAYEGERNLFINDMLVDKPKE